MSISLVRRAAAAASCSAQAAGSSQAGAARWRGARETTYNRICCCDRLARGKPTRPKQECATETEGLGLCVCIGARLLAGILRRDNAWNPLHSRPAAVSAVQLARCAQ
jgi:hypothetical protein